MEPTDEEPNMTTQKLEAKKMEDFLNSLDKIVYWEVSLNELY